MNERRMKECTKCGEFKPYTEFYRNKQSKDGLHHWCKNCSKQYNKQYCQDNKEKIKECAKQYRQDNQEHLKEYSKQHYQDNKEKHKEYFKQRYQANKEHFKQRYQANKEKHKEYAKQYRQDNKEHFKQYYQDNKEKLKEYYQDNKEKHKEYAKQHYQTYKKKINAFKDFCALCGFRDKPALVFHHRDPKNKLFTIGRRTLNLKTLIEETKKCLVLCANCHRLFHYYNRNPSKRPEILLKKYLKLGLKMNDEKWISIKLRSEKNVSK